MVGITGFEYPYEYFLALLGAPSADVCFAHTPPHVRKLEIHKTKKKPLMPPPDKEVILKKIIN